MARTRLTAWLLVRLLRRWRIISALLLGVSAHLGSGPRVSMLCTRVYAWCMI